MSGILMAETFGQLLRRYREMRPGPPTKANRFRSSQDTASIQAIAERAGIDRSYLCLLERDERPSPRRHKVERLAEALHLDERGTDRLLAAAGLWPFPDLNGADLDTVLELGRWLSDHEELNEVVS